MTRPRAFVRAQNGQTLLMDVPVKVHRLSLPARAAQKHDSPAETGQVKRRRHRFRMTRRLEDYRRILAAAGSPYGLFELFVRKKPGVSPQRCSERNPTRILVNDDHGEPQGNRI